MAAERIDAAVVNDVEAGWDSVHDALPTYHDGSRWSKVEDPSWYERESLRLGVR